MIGDGVITLIIVLVMIPAIFQFIWSCIFKSQKMKRLPIIILIPIWIISVLGAFDIIALPETNILIRDGFMTFYDYTVIAVIGLPVMFGIACGSVAHSISLQNREKKKTNPEDPK